MEGKRLIHHITIAISTAIFLYQSITAFLKLNAKQTIFISEVIDINDLRVSQPLITVCMTDQIPDDQQINDDLVYVTNKIYLLYQLRNNADFTFSFGKHLNMTYKQLMKKYSKPRKNFLAFEQNGYHKDGNETFIQLYGYCSEMTDFQPNDLLNIVFVGKEKEKYDIFVTDWRLETYLSPDFTSQTGDRLEISNGTNYGFVVKIEVEDLTDPYEKSSCVQVGDQSESFSNCVNTGITADLMPKLGCIPPWLSPHNQCNDIYQGGSELDDIFIAACLCPSRDPSRGLPCLWPERDFAD